MKIPLLASVVWFVGCAGIGPTAWSGSAGEGVYREYCGSCHDPVPPDAYTDNQWRGVINRMQAEAGLTDAEAQSVLGWLQESNAAEAR